MQAETVYNVFMALPETEKLRLYKMVDADIKLLTPVEEQDDGQLTDAECKEALLKVLNGQRAKKIAMKTLRVIK